ncbi:hypothetical protein [Hymenobacter koreensis]|uniref:SRPBCC family protein n=1 Tax=Hymenobacter koreensis TaxID=1084523 RepID=A0ABP8J5J8_9BACT
MEPADFTPQPEESGAEPSSFKTWLTTTQRGCVVLAVVPTAVLCAGLTALSTNAFRQYGMMLFMASPFICGMAASTIFTALNPQKAGSNFRVAGGVTVVLAVLTTLALLVFSALEGVICVLMAAPFALLMGAVGSVFGQFLGATLGQGSRMSVLATVVVLYPVGQHYEAANQAPAAPHEVVTQVHIKAAPAAVWQVITQPVQYPAKVGPLFKAGVAYPTRTALKPAANGQRVLECTYSQGKARLPITVWKPSQELQFTVPETPAPMKELSPYPRIHAPHLHGYFQVESGTFRLLAQPDGSTLLEGRTVYLHSMGPRAYWQLWSDYLLDDMHARVLHAIKTQAEHAPAQPRL